MWNRSGGAATDLAAATPGCRAVPAARDLGAARLAFCCLANDEATEAVRGSLERWWKAAGWLGSSGACSGAGAGASTSPPPTSLP